MPSATLAADPWQSKSAEDRRPMQLLDAIIAELHPVAAAMEDSQSLRQLLTLNPTQSADANASHMDAQAAAPRAG